MVTLTLRLVEILAALAAQATAIGLAHDVHGDGKDGILAENGGQVDVAALADAVLVVRRLGGGVDKVLGQLYTGGHGSWR